VDDAEPAWAAIPLGPPLPTSSSSLPAAISAGPAAGLSSAATAWPCTRWGLPCPGRRRPGGALLPHPFTLAWSRL